METVDKSWVFFGQRAPCEALRWYQQKKLGKSRVSGGFFEHNLSIIWMAMCIINVCHRSKSEKVEKHVLEYIDGVLCAYTQEGLFVRVI